MKKLAAIIFISLFAWACANEASRETNTDTTNTTIAPDNTINADSANRAGDTSSYDRMPQESSDSMPK